MFSYLIYLLSPIWYMRPEQKQPSRICMLFLQPFPQQIGEYSLGIWEILPEEGIWTKTFHPPRHVIWLLTYTVLRRGPNISCQTIPNNQLFFLSERHNHPFLPPQSWKKKLTVLPWDMEHVSTFSNNYAMQKTCSLKWLKIIFSLWKLKTVAYFHLIITRFLRKSE